MPEHGAAPPADYADFRFQITDFRLQISDFRFQISDEGWGTLDSSKLSRAKAYFEKEGFKKYIDIVPSAPYLPPGALVLPQL